MSRNKSQLRGSHPISETENVVISSVEERKQVKIVRKSSSVAPVHSSGDRPSHERGLIIIDEDKGVLLWSTGEEWRELSSSGSQGEQGEVEGGNVRALVLETEINDPTSKFNGTYKALDVIGDGNHMIFHTYLESMQLNGYIIFSTVDNDWTVQVPSNDTTPEQLTDNQSGLGYVGSENKMRLWTGSEDTEDGLKLPMDFSGSFSTPTNPFAERTLTLTEVPA